MNKKEVKLFLSMCKTNKIFPPSDNIYSTGDGYIRFFNVTSYVSYNTQQSFPEFSMSIKDFKAIIESGLTDMKYIVEKYKHLTVKVENINLPEDFDENVIGLHNVNALRLIAKSFCSDDSLRPLLMGVHFEDDVICATDAYILYSKSGFIAKISDYTPFTIDKDDIANLKANLYSVYKNEGMWYTFKDHLNKIEYSCRAVEGKYPDFKSVIPESPKYKFSINRNQLIDRLKTLSIGIESPKVKFNLVDRSITVFNTEIQNSDKINIILNSDDYEYDEFGFMVEKLITVLNYITDVNVNFEFNSPSKPFLLNKILLMPTMY